MRRIGRSRVLLGAVLLSALLPVTVAFGGQSVSIPSELEALLRDRFGLDDDQVPRWADGLVGVGDDWSAFGWGGDASVPPTISEDEAPWTVPTTIGLNYVRWLDPAGLPDFGDGFATNGILSGSVNGGPTVGSLYAVTTIVMGGEIPLGGPGQLYQQWDFVMGIPGLEAWEALPQFPDDTWNGGAFVFSLSYGPNPWSLSFYSFENGEIVTRDYPGFAVISGNTILMGVEAVPEVFGTGVEISGRIAVDVKDAPFNPSRSRVVTAPGVPLGPTAFFPYLGFTGPLVPGLPGLFDLTDFDVFVDEDGELWVKIYPDTPWGPVPPDEHFSDYVQWAIRPYGSEDSPPYGGFQTHDGASETFSGLGSERGDPIEGYIMGPDGALLFRTGIEYDGGDLEVFLQGGFLQDEGSTILYNQHRTTVFEEEVGESDEPTSFDDEFPIYDLAVGEAVTPPPEPTTTTGATTTTVVTTTTVATTVPPIAGDDGGMSWPLIFLLIGLLLLLLWLLWRWYSNRTEESKDIYRFGPTRERSRPSGGGVEDGGGDDPRDAPPPVGYGEEIEEHTACAWGLYFHDGTREIAIREPEIHEHLCCKYVVRVATDVTAHAQAARGRQDAGAERLRIPDFDYGWRWVDLVANSSTRSGPAGRLDWMQGLGDPTDQSTPLDPYWQEGSESPEVAAHLTHRERTEIDITLEPGCPAYKNLYSVSAKSQLELLATHECTNDAGDPCPVELNGFGFFGGWIIGPGNIFCGASDWTGSDPDELEQSPLAEERIRAGGTPHTPSDAHDHVERDRVAYQVSESDAASDALEQDDLWISIENDVELDAGQVVPVAVYPTTDRVSTHIEGDLKHDLQIQVNLTPIACDENNCGGHGPCSCEAEWTMQVSGAGGSWIDAGDGPFEILREPTAADRRAPFTGKRSWTGKT